MKFLGIIGLFGLLMITQPGLAQDEIDGVKFETKLSKNSLGINERLRVDFVMNKDGDNFNPPSFENFTVVGGPNSSISNSWINGKRSYSKTYSYFLAPKKRGTFTIGQATIEINGNIFKTIPIKVEVTAAVTRPKDPNDPDYIVSQNIHLIAEVSNTNPYLNEAINVVYKLYVSPNTGVSNWKEIDNPRYNDFWSQNIDMKGLKVQNGTYKGEDYRFVVLRKTVLYPQKTGKLNIEPLALDITVEVPTNRRDIFGGRLMKSVNKTVAAGSRTINVKPLPESDRPANFSGAVGDFSFQVTTSKDELKATEALIATVEVSGKGNLKLFKLPKLTIPSSLEVYEPEHDERVSTNLGGMQGKIADSYTIVPSYQGKYPIPSISFSYFNPRTEQYETIASDELFINVTEGPVNKTVSPVVTQGNQKQLITGGNQFASFKTRTTLESMESRQFFKSKLFWSSLLGPLLAIPVAILFRRRQQTLENDILGNRKRQADKLARRYLSDAKKNMGDKDHFYEALHKSLHNYLKAKISIETTEFSKEKIKELLTACKVKGNVIDGFIMLLKSCELARFTPSSKAEMQSDYNRAADVIAQMDKQIR
ncbi:MAG: BatD family protein [Bacteroidia bacterium]|nr:BatD family protein [Bacteroidia bacterium]NNK71801.1 protein BatD [Flavobacteriaceae bacterium]